MKKLIFFIFCLVALFLFFIIKVNAETIYYLEDKFIEIGIGNETYLQEKDLILQSGTVDFNKEGKYVITYKDNNNTTYKQNVNIIPNKETYLLSNGNYNELEIPNNHNIVDIFYINENSYYLISNYQIEDPTYYDQENICVMYYENYEYKWEYHYLKYSYYKSGFLKDNNIVITGVVYNENNNYINSIVLFEITKDRQIIKSKEIKSDKTCTVHGMHYYDNYIYLITDTSGNQFDYKDYKRSTINNVVIFKIDYNTFQIRDGYCEERLEDYRIQDVSFYENKITFNASLKENIIVSGATITNVIYEYDETLELKNTYPFSTKYNDYLGYQITHSEICFFAIDRNINDKCVRIQYLNKGVINKNIYLELENEYPINRVEVVNINGLDLYLNIKYDDITFQYDLGYCKVNSINGVVYYTHTPVKQRALKAKISNGELIKTFYENDKLYSQKQSLIEITTIENPSKDRLVKGKIVYVNGCDTDVNIVYSDVDYKVFGTYTQIKLHTANTKNKFYLSELIEVYFDSNIINDETYQTGYIIKFNGEGMLNGEYITSDTSLNDIGSYRLVITGHNNEKILNFTISDLTINHTERETNNLELLDQENYITKYKDESYVNTNIDIKPKNRSAELIPFSLSILTIGILSLILLRKKI